MNPLSAADRSFFNHLFTAVAEDMGVTLCRTAHSPNIKERRDYSCALFDAQGQLIAQAAHIPVHLGALPTTMRAVIERFPRLEEGDVVIVNDPFAGGTHLPDITLVSPVFFERRKAGYVVSRAHHADVGGISPGSLPLSTHIDEEGVRIAPYKLIRRGKLDQAWLDSFLSQVRTPEEREGDLQAQLAAHHVGTERFKAIVKQYGGARIKSVMQALQAYGEDLMRQLIRKIPEGCYEFKDALDDDGQGHRMLPIAVSLTVRDETVHLDFKGSHAACAGSLNAVEAITQSAVYYCFLCLLLSPGLLDDQPLAYPPINEGSLRPIQIDVPKNSLLAAEEPHAVAGGNVETSQRIVDVVFGALAQALPGCIPAASQGTMNNMTLGGNDPRTGRAFAYYETLGGGAGASAAQPGLDAVQVHMTNTLNTPIEALEFAYPFRVREYAIRQGSGGNGAFRGGNGLVRELEMLADTELTLLTERRRTAPYGLAGGEPGQMGRNLLGMPALQVVDAKLNTKLKRGDRIRLETPGGGGYGIA